MELDRLLDNNRNWVAERLREDPECFQRMAAKHEPHFLWIGCSDARVPANVITGTDAGEMFVHRNIANQVHPTDSNLAAVVQYAIEVLKVKDIIICGHAECGGVRAALGPSAPPAVEQWIAQVRTVARIHSDELEAIPEADRKVAKLVELNVLEGIHNLARLPVVQKAWKDGADVSIHGLVYDLHEGLLRHLGVTLTGETEHARVDPQPRRRGARSGKQVAVRAT